jgi:hypothetical protein
MTSLKLTKTQISKIAGAFALASAALSTPTMEVRAATTTTTTTTVVTTQNARAPRVMLNRQPLATSVPPQIMNGVTFVPMRDIFEALGATVVWVPETQEIRARKDGTKIWLQIGNPNARVGETSTTLAESPRLDRGSTLVPLRFVSEALGADVKWNGRRRVVSISTGEFVASTPDVTNTDVRGSITIPAGAVVPVTLDQTLSSKTARVGDKFSATVKSEKAGDSEFPPGTKIWGRVTEVRPVAEGSPGVLGLEFTGAELPNGRRVALQGDLISLDDQSVMQSGGRIMAKASTKKSTDLKVIGIGAAAGFILGKVLDKNSTITAILGAAGGYLYSRSKDKGKEQEAVVDQGATLGVRLTSSATYTDTTYYNEREPYLGNG